MNIHTKKYKTKKFLLSLTVILFFLSSCRIYRILTFTNSITNNIQVSKTHYKEVIPFNYENWIFINANINGATTSSKFLLDTGSPSFINFKTKDSLSIQSKRILSSKEVGRFDIATTNIMLGNLSFINSKFLVLDYMDFNAIIGVNIMQNSIWSINFLDSTITITNELDSVKEYTNNFKAPFTYRGKQKTPIIKLLINGKDSVEAIIDTGEPTALLFNKEFNLNSISEVTPENIATSQKNNNLLYHSTEKDSIKFRSIVRLTELRIGELIVKNSIAIHRHSYSGLSALGLDFLKNYIVTFDWNKQLVYFKPILGRQHPENQSSYGFNCWVDSTNIVVTDIFDKSKAKSIGLQSGDQIESINSILAKNIDSKTVQQINEGNFTNAIEIKLKGKQQILTIEKYNLLN